VLHPFYCVSLAVTRELPSKSFAGFLRVISRQSCYVLLGTVGRQGPTTKDVRMDYSAFSFKNGKYVVYIYGVCDTSKLTAIFFPINDDLVAFYVGIK